MPRRFYKSFISAKALNQLGLGRRSARLQAAGLVERHHLPAAELEAAGYHRGHRHQLAGLRVAALVVPVLLHQVAVHLGLVAFVDPEACLLLLRPGLPVPAVQVRPLDLDLGCLLEA